MEWDGNEGDGLLATTMCLSSRHVRRPRSSARPSLRHRQRFSRNVLQRDLDNAVLGNTSLRLAFGEFAVPTLHSDGVKKRNGYRGKGAVTNGRNNYGEILVVLEADAAGHAQLANESIHDALRTQPEDFAAASLFIALTRVRKSSGGVLSFNIILNDRVQDDAEL